MRKFSIALAFLALAAAPAWGATCKGELQPGTLDSAVGDCSFASKGAMARKIFAACQMGDVCEVSGTVKGDWLQSVDSVKLIRKAN